jgi:alpha-beta hydrolase superfamily lysophospholipase
MRKYLKKSAFALLLIFVSMNVVAYLHAYRFTHFSEPTVARTADPKALSILTKLRILVMGIDNPRPSHERLPTQTYSVVYVNSTERLECWKIDAAAARGTVILFHGYAGEKSSMISRSEFFHAMGFNTVLVDFMGSGGSEGSATTIGFQEAEQVNDCLKAFRQPGKAIYLFGTSMGAAAILKAADSYAIKPDGIILECPFGSLYRTVSARFEMMGVPAFPMSGLLTFWGGAQHGYWAFSHNPSAYASAVDCPTLLLFGEKDDRVSREEIDEIFQNLKGPKTLKTYAAEGHQVFSERNRLQWQKDVVAFLETL